VFSLYFNLFSMVQLQMSARDVMMEVHEYRAAPSIGLPNSGNVTAGREKRQAGCEGKPKPKPKPKQIGLFTPFN
jgi:hypothetical protein